MKVLLLDEAFVSGALAAQGLRRAGCHVHVIAAAGGRGSCRTRDSTWELAPPPGAGLDELIDARVREGRFGVVYPVTEPLQRLAWSTERAWARVVFPCVDSASLERYASKRRMSAAVRAAGVSVPEEHDARTAADVDAGVRALGLPVVVKGSVGRGGSATVIATSARRARAAAERLRRLVPEVFLQRHVAGDTYLAGGVFDRGRALRLYMGKKTVQFPRRVGPAAELLSVADCALQSAALQAFQAARVSGIASADFIRDADGRFHFLELNPRPWGSMAGAAAAGVDLCGPLVSLWRGEPVAPSLGGTAGVRTPTLPLYALSASMWMCGAVAAALPGDLARVVRLAWREPALAAHLAHRCARVLLNLQRVSTRQRRPSSQRFSSSSVLPSSESESRTRRARLSS